MIQEKRKKGMQAAKELRDDKILLQKCKQINLKEYG